MLKLSRHHDAGAEDARAWAARVRTFIVDEKSHVAHTSVLVLLNASTTSLPATGICEDWTRTRTIWTACGSDGGAGRTGVGAGGGMAAATARRPAIQSDRMSSAISVTRN